MGLLIIIVQVYAAICAVVSLIELITDMEHERTKYHMRRCDNLTRNVIWGLGWPYFAVKFILHLAPLYSETNNWGELQRKRTVRYDTYY